MELTSPGLELEPWTWPHLKPVRIQRRHVFPLPSKQWLHFLTSGSLSDEMSTSSTTTSSFSFLLASASFTTADLTTYEEEGPAAEEECMPFFFTATDEAGTVIFLEVIPHLFLNLGGRTGTSSTSTFTATSDEGAATEEGANRPVPGSLWQWRLSALVISKGSGGYGSGEEARGVEGGGGEGGERMEAPRVECEGGKVSEAMWRGGSSYFINIWKRCASSYLNLKGHSSTDVP